jgi:hypothetical protein
VRFAPREGLSASSPGLQAERGQCGCLCPRQCEAAQLVAATKTFHSSVGRWPQTYQEFGSFVLSKNMPLDLAAFNDVTFAALEDGSVQIHYDVNCSRFSDKEYQFTQTGSVNAKAK